MAKRQFILILLLVFGLMQALPGEEKSLDQVMKNPLGLDKAAIAAGAELFQSGCGACHGLKGQGGRGPKLADNGRLRDKSDKTVFDIIKLGIPGTVMPPADLGVEQIWQLVAFVRSLSVSAAEQSIAGDPAVGEQLFFGAKKCSECHMIRGNGGLIGPDLSNVGGSRSVSKIAEAISEPSTVIEPGFAAVTVTTRDGRRITGIAKNNSNFSIQIFDAKGSYHLLLKKNLLEVVYHRDSLMPRVKLSDSELQNLLAFLSRQTLGMPANKVKMIEHGKEQEP